MKIHGQTRFLIDFNNLLLWYRKRIKTLLLVVLKTQKVCKKGKSNQNYCLEERWGVIFTFNVQSLDGPLIIYLNNSWELSFCSIFKMLVSKYLYGHWLIRINIKKNIWGGCEGLIPLKPQSCPKMVFLTASSHLSYRNKIEKNMGHIFYYFWSFLKSSNYPPP